MDKQEKFPFSLPKYTFTVLIISVYSTIGCVMFHATNVQYKYKFQLKPYIPIDSSILVLESTDSFEWPGRGVLMGIMAGTGIDPAVILLLKDKDSIMNGKSKSKIM